MRFEIATLLLLGLSQPLHGQEPPGHPVDLALWGGYLELNDDIRFEGDSVLELGAAFGIVDWFELNVSLFHMRSWDRSREDWSDVVGFSLHGNLWPAALERLQLGAVAGVSFMGFDDGDAGDSMVEGLDLGLAWRHRLGAAWQLRVEALGRLQSFDFVPVDASGLPSGSAEETGYLWSPLFRLGILRAL